MINDFPRLFLLLHLPIALFMIYAIFVFSADLWKPKFARASTSRRIVSTNMARGIGATINVECLFYNITCKTEKTDTDVFVQMV